MFKVFAVVVLSVFLALNPAYAVECPAGTDTEEAFFKYTEKSKFVVYTLSEKALDKFKASVNSVREKNGVVLFSKTAKFYFAAIDAGNTGVVWMDDGCVVAESVVLVPKTGLAELFYKIGLKPEDIIKVAKRTPA